MSGHSAVVIRDSMLVLFSVSANFVLLAFLNLFNVVVE